MYFFAYSARIAHCESHLCSETINKIKLFSALNQGIGIKGRAMVLVWHEKADKFGILYTYSFGTDTQRLQSRKLKNNIVNYN